MKGLENGEAKVRERITERLREGRWTTERPGKLGTENRLRKSEGENQ